MKVQFVESEQTNEVYINIKNLSDYCMTNDRTQNTRIGKLLTRNSCIGHYVYRHCWCAIDTCPISGIIS